MTDLSELGLENRMQMIQMISSQIFALENQTLKSLDIPLVAVDGANPHPMSIIASLIYDFEALFETTSLEGTCTMTSLMRKSLGSR